MYLLMKASHALGFQGGKSHGESELRRVMLREEPLRILTGKGNMVDSPKGGPDFESS